MFSPPAKYFLVICGSDRHGVFVQDVEQNVSTQEVEDETNQEV